MLDKNAEFSCSDYVRKSIINSINVSYVQVTGNFIIILYKNTSIFNTV